ncbi:MAG: aminoacyl-tRNA hydrolase [Metamycoplasmataceae bacterium]
MKLIIGLGNPGDEYKGTRHNVGFDLLDKLIKEFGVTWSKSKFNGEVYINEDFILAKPHTFMNLSGNFVKTISDYYKINHVDILVLYDDVDTAIGKVKIKTKSSSGGQNGIKSILELMRTNEIKRVKIGIGRPPNKSMPLSSYVLSPFTEEEREQIDKTLDKLVDPLITFIYNDIKVMLDKFSETKDEK